MNKKKVDMLRYAIKYREEHGFSIIPVKGKGGHLVEWTKYQTEKPTIEEIKDWWRKWPDANIGIITGAISGITVIDFDLYKLTEEEKQALNSKFPLVATPIVHSGSGGEHRYFAYNPDIKTKNNITKGLDTKNDGGVIIAPPSRNDKGIYKWDNRAKLSAMSLRSIPPAYIDNINTYNNNNNSYNGHNNLLATNDNKYFTEGRRDEDLFTVANALMKCKLDPSLVRQALKMIANNLGPEFNDKVIDSKINSAFQRAERQERNITEEAKLWVSSLSGHFRLQEGHNELQLTTARHKKAFNMAVARMTEGDEPLVKKYGNARGVYTRIENDLTEIDWAASNDEELDFQWMLGFSEYVKTMPKTIYVIAGEPDSGKSAICLNLALQNCFRIPIAYFSSEMGGEELSSRMKLYNDFDERAIQNNIKFYERDGNFEDVIKPNHVNIIDYYEISKDFWEIAESLKRIRQALNKGIAIIAVQKKRGVALGRGAEFGLEKPRLYMRVEPYRTKKGRLDGNLIAIEKAKNWRDPTVNPNGLCMRFNLIKGINLKPISTSWTPEMEERANEKYLPIVDKRE